MDVLGDRKIMRESLQEYTLGCEQNTRKWATNKVTFKQWFFVIE